MPRSAEEQAAWVEQCYGTTEAQLDEYIEGVLTHGDRAEMFAMSRLSDAQHLMELASEQAGADSHAATWLEEARKIVNQAKYALSKIRLQDRMAAGWENRGGAS